MREDKIKTEEAAALWRRARQGWAPPPGEGPDDPAPDPLLLAAYLDGSLEEEEAARLEARLAADTALLDEVLALRQGLGEDAGAVPGGVVARAQGLRPQGQAAAVRKPSRPGTLLAGWLRPAVPAFAVLALMLACAGAFQLGLYQADQLGAGPSTEASDSELPVDLVLDGLI